VRTAFYKIYYPIEFYAAYFSIRISDFDISLFRQGYKAIAKRYDELAPTVNSMSAKDKEMFQGLEMALEMTARGFSFKNIDIHASHSRKFIIQGQSLMPPFCAVSGCGESVAQSIELARGDGEFLSIEDFQSRSKCSKTVIDTMREMGCFVGMSENNQMSLFDF
jgi:DNA polymerase-3 subunit alpha (Gram-positive type)